MKKLQVIYNGWGARWPLGTLLDTGAQILFEYSAQAIQTGIELSPLHHPLPRAGSAVVTFRGVPDFYGLPGFVADALPDGWGMLLMDRALRRAGRDLASVSVLDRLTIVGDRAIGALSFEPAEEGTTVDERLRLADIAQQVAELQSLTHEAGPMVGQSVGSTGLSRLLRLGGSPQGARPKVLVNFDPESGEVGEGAQLQVGASPWLVKFPAQGEHREVCALEEAYARLARAGGMDMPRSHFFDLGAQYSAFGVERFDRVVSGEQSKAAQVRRVPVVSLSAMLQANHRLPSLDYETVLLATLRITGDQRELLKAFERCVWNVLLHNRDDHSRNFAFRMDEQCLWKLAPEFDLTFSDGPGGEHSTSVMGHGKSITRGHLLDLAKRAGVTQKMAQERIAAAIETASALNALAMDLPIRKSSLRRVSDGVSSNIKYLTH